MRFIEPAMKKYLFDEHRFLMEVFRNVGSDDVVGTCVEEDRLWAPKHPSIDIVAGILVGWVSIHKGLIEIYNCIKSKPICYELSDPDSIRKARNYVRRLINISHVIKYLNLNDPDRAKRMVEWDWDKISNYPEIAEYLKEVGLIKSRI